MNILPIDMQRLNEERYYKGNVDKLIRAELDIPEIEDLVLQGVELLKAWLNQDYYDSKQARLQVIKEMNLTELTREVFICSVYSQQPELFTSVSAKLAAQMNFSDRVDSIKTMAEILTVLAETNMYDIYKQDKYDSLMFKSNVRLDEETARYAANVGYLPPMVVKPRKLTRNYQSAYESFNDSLILGKGNFHDGDICLDVLNSKNAVPLCLNQEFLELEETPKREPETIDAERNFEEFKKQSRAICKLMIGQGNEFYLSHKVDKRGRIYTQGYHISTQGSSYKKASIDLAEKELVEVPQFTVDAGKYEHDGEKNYKFCSEPMSYQDAVELAKEYQGYPFVEINPL